MPLSKAKNRDRMREYRLHKQLSAPYQSKAVQPNPLVEDDFSKWSIEPNVWSDTDGNPIYGD